MSLTPIDRAPTIRDFATYDLEWIPHALEIRCIGTYDGESYRAFTDMGAFLDYALSSDRRGKWYYAHAGGLYDIQFVFDYIFQHRREEYEIDAKFSGSSAIIVKIKKGKNCWYFLDSYWLLRAPLREIGEKMVGIKKGGLDPNEGATREQIEAYYRDTPLPELIEYNRTDCEILWRAIALFQQNLLDLGGQLQMTLASSAMALFRRRFLKREIKTRDGVNRTARGAYIASRVEVLSKTCESANYYDINSSFPFAMTQPAPGKLLSMRRTVPKGEHQLYIAKAVISSPERFLPPLPFRTPDHRIYFPTGTWEGNFTNVDLELLEEVGGKIESIEEVLTFEPCLDLADYATTLYEMRRTLDDSDPMRTILKLLLNSLGGAPLASAGGAALSKDSTESLPSRAKSNRCTRILPPASSGIRRSSNAKCSRRGSGSRGARARSSTLTSRSQPTSRLSPGGTSSATWISAKRRTTATRTGSRAISGAPSPRGTRSERSSSKRSCARKIAASAIRTCRSLKQRGQGACAPCALTSFSLGPSSSRRSTTRCTPTRGSVS